MRSLDEIKASFQHKNYGLRSDFIEEYDFQDNYRDYYHDFILKQDQIKNPIYLSDLIDLAAALEFQDETLIKRYRMYLLNRQHYIVKLAVLDYFFEIPDIMKVYSKYEEELNKLLKGKLFAVLRNQILINLIKIASDQNRDYYLTLLYNSLKQMHDWRSIYRTLLFCSYDELKKEKDNVFRLIQKLHEEKDFGQGVENLLKKYL